MRKVNHILFPYSHVVVHFVACCGYNVDRWNFAPKDGVSRQKTRPNVLLPKFVTPKEFKIQEADPGLWDINDPNTIEYWIHSGLSTCQNHDSDLSNSCRVYKKAGAETTKTRYVSNNVFKRELRNGECIKCEWLLYSPSQGSLYCFVCRLLSKKDSPFATSGFNDWKYSKSITEHENGEEHRKCMTAYLIRHNKNASIDSLLIEQHRSEQEYWHKVLTRVWKPRGDIRVWKPRGDISTFDFSTS